MVSSIYSKCTSQLRRLRGNVGDQNIFKHCTEEDYLSNLAAACQNTLSGFPPFALFHSHGTLNIQLYPKIPIDKVNIWSIYSFLCWLNEIIVRCICIKSNLTGSAKRVNSMPWLLGVANGWEYHTSASSLLGHPPSDKKYHCSFIGTGYKSWHFISRKMEEWWPQ